MPEQATMQEIEITRVYDAPRELVWRAWTEPAELVCWWGPPGWSTALDTVTMEVRPGGAFRLASVHDDGREVSQDGFYREVVEPDRIVLEEPAERNWHEGAVTEITFTDLGDGRTQVVVRTSVRTTDEMCATAERGMRETLERLGGHLGR